MNKTVNMNLGGFFFHIDEDAYQKLNRYFDAIKRSLTNDGRDEIMNDIEGRVSELFSEKLTSEKQVIGTKDVDDVIAVMGQPEDFKIDDDGTSNSNSNSSSTSSFRINKKLYRDRDNAMLGGVLSGLSYYLGIDRTWLRLALLILLFFAGTGFLLYIILWIVMPEANTTSEKLAMKGEPVNIENIERKVREGFQSVSDTLKNSGEILKEEANRLSDKFGQNVNNNRKNLGDIVGNIAISVLNVFSKFLGGMLVLSGITVLFFLLVGIFTLGTGMFIDFPWQNFIESGNYSDYPAWSFGLLMFFAVGIPFFFLTLLGFKLLSPNIKSIGNPATYTLIGIWLISIAFSIAVGVKQASAFANDGRIVLKEKINLNPTDTLYVKFVHNDFFAKNVNENENFRILNDSTNKEVIYSNNVSMRFEKTDAKTPYIQIEKEAKGKSLSEAKQKAEQIRYGYKILGNKIILDNYLLTDIANKFRDQEIEITIFVPVGMHIKPDDSLENYDITDNDYFEWNVNENNIFKVENNKIVCTNCSSNQNFNVNINDDENDFNDDEEINMNPNVTINKDGITIKNDTVISNSDDFKELKISKDGIIIKTK
jgi:phage shock protein PspC (stress-responsive transcriptional regulator)